MMLASSVFTDIARAFLQGLPPGTVYALVALGFVLTYRTSGIFNLAFGAQAYVSAVAFFTMRVTWEWPALPSLVLSVFVLAPLVGVLGELAIFRHLRNASALAKLVVTIGLAVALPSLAEIAFSFNVQSGRTPEGVLPNGANVFYDPFGIYAFSRNELVAMIVVVVSVILLGSIFRFTALGLRMKAVVESARMTQLAGIAADRVSATAWAMSSLFAGLAGVLIAPRFNTLAAGDFFNLAVVAIAAAVVGGLTSLPRALAGGIGLGVIIAELNTFLPRWSESASWLRPLQDHLTPAIPFLVLFGVLVFQPSIRRPAAVSDPLAGVDPPVILGAAHWARNQLIARRGAAAVVLAIVAVVVLTNGDASWLYLVTQAVVMSVIFMSITVITGLGGEIALCQGAFAATGAFTVYQLAMRYDMGGIPAAFIGAAIAGVLGALLSLPIRRLGGVWTAIATLAFAYFFDSVVLNLPFVGGGTSLLTGTAVPRPVIGSIDFGSDKSFLVLALVVAIVVAILVTNLKSGTFGRVLLALQGSEVGARSIGISPGRARLMAFATAAAIAGFGGALLAMQQKSVNYGSNFSPFVALVWVVIVVTIGSRTVSGAIQAAGAFVLFEPVILKGAFLGWILRSPDRIPSWFPISGRWVLVLFGLGTIMYARYPAGLSEFGAARASARRHRRQQVAAAAAAATVAADAGTPTLAERPTS